MTLQSCEVVLMTEMAVYQRRVAVRGKAEATELRAMRSNYA